LWNVISEGTTHSLHALLLPKWARTLRKRWHSLIVPKFVQRDTSTYYL
jgi:hypothetical protein